MTTSIYTDHPDFISNKYSNWYYSIIENAKSQVRSKGQGTYYENHHILPKSIFPEFSKEKWNMVLLTAKEHYTVHHLLTKFTISKSKYRMYHAYSLLNCMNHQQSDRCVFNVRQYDRSKRLNAKATSYNHTGKTFDDEYKQKIREGLSIGTFITPWGEFVSATQAGKECPTGIISSHTILMYCGVSKRRKTIVVTRQGYIQSPILRSFGTKDKIVGRRYTDLGFWFIK